jgi:hypothetical protein
MKSPPLGYLALLFTPLVWLASAHELFLRNQADFGHDPLVLVPFWIACGALFAAGLVLRRFGWRWPLAAYMVAGLLSATYLLLRGLPFWGGFMAWLLDGSAPVAAFVLALVLGTLGARRHPWPPALGRALSAMSLVLLASQTVTFVGRLTLPRAEEASRPLPPVDPRLPNVYHFIFDGFQGDVFENLLSDDVLDKLRGFARFPQAVSTEAATSVSLPCIFLSRPLARHRSSVAEALESPSSLVSQLRARGYRTVAFVPLGVYPMAMRTFDLVLLQDQEPQVRHALDRPFFWRLWLHSTLPAAVTRPLAAGNVLHFGPDDLRDIRLQRLSTYSQPLVARLSERRFINLEASWPARGRYTLVHLLAPHNPFLLESDCSFGDSSRRTRPEAQHACAMLMVAEILSRLRDLGRLDDAVVTIHADHGSALAWRDGTLVPDESQAKRALLLFKAPGAHRPSWSVASAATLLDVAPTLLALAGLPAPPDYEGRALPQALPSHRR